MSLAPYLYNAAYYRLDCSANKDLKETLIQYIEHNLNAAKTAGGAFYSQKHIVLSIKQNFKILRH